MCTSTFESNGKKSLHKKNSKLFFFLQYDNIQATIRQLSPLKRYLFNMALSAKGRDVDHHRVTRHMLWDGIVLKRIQERLGGRMKLIASGAAPLSPTILQFLKRVCGAYVVEGYGQTECCGVSSCQMFGDPTTGNIGVPFNCNMIKLADVADMQYYAKDNVGELCIKGANVFKGYYRDEEKTREALDNEGWLHTGDIAKWAPVGNFVCEGKELMSFICRLDKFKLLIGRNICLN
jgi:long-chain acyl-CoA synthetase